MKKKEPWVLDGSFFKLEHMRFARWHEETWKFDWSQFHKSMIENTVNAQTVFEVKSIQDVNESIKFLKKNKYYPFDK